MKCESSKLKRTENNTLYKKDKKICINKIKNILCYFDFQSHNICNIMNKNLDKIIMNITFLKTLLEY